MMAPDSTRSPAEARLISPPDSGPADREDDALLNAKSPVVVKPASVPTWLRAAQRGAGALPGQAADLDARPRPSR